MSSEQLPASAIEMSGGKSTSCRLLSSQPGHEGRAVGGGRASRSRKFESISLQRRVRCELNLGKRLGDEIAAGPPGRDLHAALLALIPLPVKSRHFGNSFFVRMSLNREHEVVVGRPRPHDVGFHLARCGNVIHRFYVVAAQKSAIRSWHDGYAHFCRRELGVIFGGGESREELSHHSS